MKKSVLIAMTVFLSTSVFAVDGYKDFKWGMSWDFSQVMMGLVL